MLQSIVLSKQCLQAEYPFCSGPELNFLDRRDAALDSQSEDLDAACERGMALQTREVLDAMKDDSGRAELDHLKVDGGACCNDLLMQIQADSLQVLFYGSWMMCAILVMLCSASCILQICKRADFNHAHISSFSWRAASCRFGLADWSRH